MKSAHLLRLCGLVVLAGVLPAAPAGAAPGGVIPQAARSAEKPIPMVVYLHQEGIVTGRDPGNGYQVGGGLVGALVDGALQSALSDGAKDAFAPSKGAFSAVDAEQTLMAAIRESVAPLPWIALAEGGALRDNSTAGKVALLDQSAAAQMIEADCSYTISQRFQAVYAYCSLLIAAKEGSPSSRKSRDGRNLVYVTHLEAQVELANIAKSVGGRREQWIANSGALLRQGLGHALTKVGMLVGRRLQMTAEDFAAAEDNEKFRLVTAYVGMAGEHRGRVVEGWDNVLSEFHPNAGGKSYLYKPGTDGVVFIDEGGGLFYHWTIEAPQATAST